MLRFSNKATGTSTYCPSQDMAIAFVSVRLIFCFLFSSPYSALNTYSVLVFLPPTSPFIPSHLTSIYQAMVIQSHYYSHISVLTEHPSQGPPILSSFPLLLLVNSGLISHLFSVYMHTYSSTLQIPPKHQ